MEDPSDRLLTQSIRAPEIAYNNGLLAFVICRQSPNFDDKVVGEGKPNLLYQSDVQTYAFLYFVSSLLVPFGDSLLIIVMPCCNPLVHLPQIGHELYLEHKKLVWVVGHHKPPDKVWCELLYDRWCYTTIPPRVKIAPTIWVGHKQSTVNTSQDICLTPLFDHWTVDDMRNTSAT